MTPLHLHMLILSTLLLLSASALAQTALPPQSPAAFAAALRDQSASPQFVAVTLVNDTSGETVSGCITANVLLGAMHKEYGLGYDQESVARVIAAALASASHTFHFQHEEAWASIPASAWSRYACNIIAEGQVARLADRSGQVTASPR